MGHYTATNSGQAIFTADLPIARVTIGLQDALEVIEQAHRHLAATGWVIIEQYRGFAGWPASGHPHPLVRLGFFAVFLEHLDPGFISLEVITAVLGPAGDRRILSAEAPYPLNGGPF